MQHLGALNLRTKSQNANFVPFTWKKDIYSVHPKIVDPFSFYGSPEIQTLLTTISINNLLFPLKSIENSALNNASLKNFIPQAGQILWHEGSTNTVQTRQCSLEFFSFS